jgi:hypothetical protein
MQTSTKEIPLLGFRAEKGESKYKQYYDLLFPFKEVIKEENGIRNVKVELQTKVAWNERTDKGYLYCSVPRAELDMDDKRFCEDFLSHDENGGI